MNICVPETECLMVAKTCGCSGNTNNNGSRTITLTKGSRRRKIAYSFIDAYHSLCLDRKDIILAELCACKKLLDNTIDDDDRNLIETEISELTMTLDLMD